MNSKNMAATNSKEIDLFIGGFVDTDSMELPIGVSFAGNYYQQKVRSILNINQSISIFYGHKNKEYISDSKIDFTIHRRHFFNILIIIRHIRSLSKSKVRYNSILFYNLSIYSLFYYLYFIFFVRARVVILIADAGFLSEKNITSRLLSKALSYAYGILTLREIPELRKFKSKIEIMPGIISNDVMSINIKKVSNTVFLSGSLGVTTGLILALEYFSNQSKLKLIITGVPYNMSNLEFEETLDKYKSNNIHFLGLLDYKDYVSILNTTEFSLSLRDPKEIEHQYNFPSKILEYMSHGCIVISTISYPELIDDIYLQTDFSVNGLQKCFEKILKMSNTHRENLSTKACNFVKNQFSEEVLKTKINILFKT